MFLIKPSWNFRTHFILSLVVAAAVWLVVSFATVRSAASIGIIGAADGPTSIFVASRYLLTDYLWIPAFIVMLALYKPVRRLLERIR